MRLGLNTNIVFLLLILFLSSHAHAAIVGPVNVLEIRNDGVAPAGCGAMGAVAGGISEMALDLDQDGVVDVYFGSYDGHCGAGFNLDAYTANGTVLSTQDDASGNSIMGGVTILLSDWNGLPVGPNFQAASGSTSSADVGQTDVPLVFGFRGGSNTPLTEYGYFSFTVNSADCSITFGSVDYETGGNTYSGSVAAGGSIPSLSEWGMIILSVLLGTIAIWTLNRRRDQLG